MESMDKLIAGIKHVDEMLAEEVLEPDLGRNDWVSMRTRVKLVQSAVQDDVLKPFSEALEEAEGTELALMMRRRVALLLSEASAPVYASGDASACRLLLAKAAELTPEEDQQRELEGAQVEPELYCRLQHARWLQERRRHREADRVLKRVAGATRQAGIKAAVKRLKRAPRPLTGAPPLFRLNGCGVGLYGARDRGPDGSYIATYCICLLWIPVFPLGAYRVREVDSNTYQFGSKEVLGPIARAWQALVLAGAVLAGGAAAWTSYRESPGRLAEVALEEARAAEAAGDREGAMERYAGAIQKYEGVTDLGPAAEAVVRLAAAGIPEPATPASVEPIGRVVNAFYDLPQGARAGAPAALLAKRLGAWADQIGDAGAAQASAGLSLLDMASKVAEGGAEEAWVEERRAKLRRAFADRVAEARPLQALDHYTRLRDPAALDAGKKILDSFGDAPSLWIEAEGSVTRWAEAASAAAGRGDEAGAVRAKLAGARAAHAEDLKLIEAADEKAIAKALEATPGDQELAVALAGVKRSEGDAKGALALLSGLGAPGRLTAEAQQLLGGCYSDAGDLAKADEVLSAFLDERLPAYQEAQRAFFDAAQEVERKVMAQVRSDVTPPDLEARIKGVTGEAEQREIFQQWLGEQIDKAPGLGALRGEYQRHAAVVPASLMLGMVKLRRAADAPGGERRALLDAAERAFLSIRREAAGSPTFHLGLGQVYHRLGRPKDGDAELQGVLDRNDPDLSLLVARAYRELGLDTRARQVCEKIYNDAASQPVHRNNAAALIAHLVSDLSEQETWLKRGDTTAPEIRNRLDDVAALQLLRAGKYAEADRALAKVTRFHERAAKHNAVAANNAAISYLNRYEATGDLAHLRSAVSFLETSARLEAGNALVLGNLGSALWHLGAVAVLDKHVQVRTLLLDGKGATSVVDAMLEGPLRGELLAALQRDPAFRKAQEVSQQAQILAPGLPTNYQTQLEWLGWSADAKGLGDLAKRVEAMPPFNAEDVAVERGKWEKGERDEELKREAADRVTRARDRLARAEKSGHKPTIAAAWLLLGEAISARSYFEAAPAVMDEMTSAYRRAAQAWPEGVTDRELAGALTTAALFKAVPESPALKRAWEAEHRVYGTSMLLHRAAAGPGGAEALAALRKQPELAEAAQLRKARLGDRPGMTDWILGRVSGDAELEQAAAKAFERPDLTLAVQIEARIYAGQAREKANLDLFASKGKGP